MIVLVTGGRDFGQSASERAWIFRRLDRFHHRKHITLLVQGEARGVDAVAKAWCLQHGIPCAGVPAHWEKFGRSAGALRNGWMVKLFGVQCGLVFPGGAGTANCVLQLTDAQIPCLLLKP